MGTTSSVPTAEQALRETQTNVVYEQARTDAACMQYVRNAIRRGETSTTCDCDVSKQLIDQLCEKGYFVKAFRYPEPHINVSWDNDWREQ